MHLMQLSILAAGAAALVSAVPALATTSSAVYIGGSRVGNDAAYTVNTATGAASVFGNVVGQMEGLSYDSLRGRIVITLRGDNTIKTLDPTTGVVGSLPIAAPASLRGLAYDSNRDLFWATNQNTGELYKVNPVTGQATLAQPVPLQGSVRPGGLGYDPVNDILYGVDNARLFSINTASAPHIPVQIGPNGFGVGFVDVDAVEFDVATGLLFVVEDRDSGGNLSNWQRFASLNPTTGVATIIGPTGLQPQFGQGMAIIPIPEPTFLSSLVVPALLALRRRR